MKNSLESQKHMTISDSWANVSCFEGVSVLERLLTSVSASTCNENQRERWGELSP
jgi:hypothetical protein